MKKIIKQEKLSKKPIKKATTKTRKKNKKQTNASDATKTLLIEFKGLLSFLIMHEINIKELAGEDLARKIGKRKGTTLTPGTIYPALKKLKTKKLVKFEKQGRRKVYRLTDKGKQELNSTYIVFSKYFYGLKNKIKRIKKTKT
ncbi:MAG: PadR family transcriptional regulator [Candidatus Woesearchaeota archaeon]